MSASSKDQDLKETDEGDGNYVCNNYRTGHETNVDDARQKPPAEDRTPHQNSISPKLPHEEPSEDTSMVLVPYGYVLGDSLGKGSYAVVKVAFSKKLRRQVAIKIIMKKKAPQDYITKFLPREITVMKRLKHPNIIGLYEAIETSSRIYLVMDMADGGDLLDYIKTNGPVCEKEARSFFRQLIDASEYLHNLDVVHRDLKCENILLDRNKNIFLTDFGFARTVPIDFDTGKRRLSLTFCGSYAYAPPEILRGVAYDGTRSDVWSLGVVLFTMLCAKLPYDDSNLKLLMEQVSRTVVFPKKRKVSEEARHLILKMLCEEKERIDISGIKEHPWYLGKKMNDGLKEHKESEDLGKDTSHDSGLGSEPALGNEAALGNEGRG
ncbi:testis-specific serine/threonine-protein kinase 3-like [Stylophora pistillata]|uniref:Testis-specific serine/threonine-protein kinase 1 n=1 Tax=Stylophora pistillata TaxID=50429 RepID=A0A2B4STN0_STYPI|nr:testis-specific serine/threonine-protein kinase 3-like [Stylophora pistillata]PFX32489.1 Testis-specific serine/threonine-protein kinase 1 [Stylophora pistillata]